MARSGNNMISVPAGIRVTSRAFRRLLTGNFSRCITDIVSGKGIIVSSDRPGQWEFAIDENVVETDEDGGGGGAPGPPSPPGAPEPPSPPGDDGGGEPTGFRYFLGEDCDGVEDNIVILDHIPELVGKVVKITGLGDTCWQISEFYSHYSIIRQAYFEFTEVPGGCESSECTTEDDDSCPTCNGCAAVCDTTPNSLSVAISGMTDCDGTPIPAAIVTLTRVGGCGGGAFIYYGSTSNYMIDLFFTTDPDPSENAYYLVIDGFSNIVAPGPLVWTGCKGGNTPSGVYGGSANCLPGSNPSTITVT